MTDRPTDNAKQPLPIDLSRRQFLQSIGFVAGVGIASADGLSLSPDRVILTKLASFMK